MLRHSSGESINVGQLRIAAFVLCILLSLSILILLQRDVTEGQYLFNLFETKRKTRDKQGEHLASLIDFTSNVQYQTNIALYQKKAVSMASRFYSTLNVSSAAYNNILSTCSLKVQQLTSTLTDVQFIYNATTLAFINQMNNITNAITVSRKFCTPLQLVVCVGWGS